MITTGLHNKVAVVTGGNHGIGAATAIALAQQGSKVFVTYLQIGDTVVPAGEPPGPTRYAANRAQPADRVIEQIRDIGGHAEAFEADLADPATIPDVFDRAEATLGSVDVLVNNAAHWEPSSFLPMPTNRPTGTWSEPPGITPEIHDRTFAVNARAAALMTAEFVRRHVARGASWGRIISVSTDGADCFPSEASYGASKAALESYSRAAASELGQFGITVNIASLGPIQTGYITREAEARLVKEIPLGRLGLPEDVADVIVFLASEQSRWLTGQTIYVGGGHRM